MTFSIILLGVLIILSIFNVGEGILKKLHLDKKWTIILLLLSLLLYFIPGVVISGITFTWVGFVLPIIISVVVLLKTRKRIDFFKMFICLLFSFSLSIAYNLITFDVYEQNIFQPYLILGLLIGVFSELIVGKPKQVFASTTVGLLLSEVFFYLSRYSIYGDYYLTLGSEKVVACILVAFITSALCYVLFRKIKAIHLRKKLERRERKGFYESV